MSEPPRQLFAEQRLPIGPPLWQPGPDDLSIRPLFSAEPPVEDETMRQRRQQQEAEAAALAAERAAAARLAAAQKEGFEQGHHSGTLAAEAQYSQRLADLAASLVELGQLRQRLLKESEAQVVQLALHVAQEVLLQSLSERQAFTARMVEEALSLLSKADSVVLRMGPEDLAAVRQARPELETMPHVQLQADTTIALGGVLADCQLGQVDATLDARLRAMAQRLGQPSWPASAATPPSTLGPLASPTTPQGSST